jgi:hypothetical protein
MRNLKAYGTSMPLTEWARLYGLRPGHLRRRLQALKGLPPEVVLGLRYVRHLDPRAKPGAPHSWTWDLLPWEDDAWAQAFLAKHPGGATLEEIAQALGLVRERVRQIEEVALRKCKREAKRLGVPVEALLGTLDELRSARAPVAL